MKQRYKTIVLSFILPFLIIFTVIVVSIFFVNNLKDIQKDSLSTLYKWEILISQVEGRYWFKKELSSCEFNQLVDDFDKSIKGLRDILPKWLLTKETESEIDIAIDFWKYIKIELEKNEQLYLKTLDTDLGQFIIKNTSFRIISDAYMAHKNEHNFDYSSFLNFIDLENGFRVLTEFIGTYTFFEKRLLSLYDNIEKVISYIITLIQIFAILVTLLVMVYIRNSINIVIKEHINSEVKLSQILNSVGDAMIVFSVDSTIIRMNPVAEDLLNIKFNDVVNKKLLNYIKITSGNSKDNIDPVSEVLESTKTVIYSEDLIVEKNDGIRIHISASGSPILDIHERLNGVVFVFKDITQRKNQEFELERNNRELLQYKEKLEVLVTQRTDKLQESLDKLKITQHQLVESEKMAALGGLVAGVAHEINTPIGIALTSASHLQLECKEFGNLFNNDNITRSAFRRFIEVSTSCSDLILNNLIRSATLIKSFKHIAVDQSSEDIRQFYIEEYINEILLSISSKFKHTSHKVEFDCPNDILIKSYPGVLAQILTNLILNSLDHGFENMEGGIISIFTEKIDGDIFIKYHDNGKGIPEENINKIFEPFFTTARSRGGSGLGMNIVYNLVTQRLKGAIECTSIVNSGTTFTINFPSNLD